MTATRAGMPSTSTWPLRQELTEWRMMPGGVSPSRTAQSETMYDSTIPPSYGMDSSAFLKLDHHALVFSFNFGVATTGGPSSVKSPLRLRSMYKRQRSAG